MKRVGKHIEEDAWAASLSRPSREIYADDIKRRKDLHANWQPDSLQVNAERIKRGEPVGDMYLWGRRAMLMVKMGMLGESDLEPHRQNYLNELKKLYSESFYEILKHNLEKRHENAK
jgi:hypothetical protein